MVQPQSRATSQIARSVIRLDYLLGRENSLSGCHFSDRSLSDPTLFRLFVAVEGVTCHFSDRSLSDPTLPCWRAIGTPAVVPLLRSLAQ